MDSHSPRQKYKKTGSSQLEKTIFRFTCFQIGLVALQLIPVCFELTSGMAVLSFFASFILVPIFILSVFIEIIAVGVIKTTYKISDAKTHQPKRLKSSTKALIVLLSMIGLTILLIVGNITLNRYYTIVDAFSREEKALTDSLYHIEIIKKDPNGGIMTARLDNDVDFDYTCEVAPFGIGSGYGPFCRYRFPDDSRSIGEYIFNKNYAYLQELLAKYQDTLIVDNAEFIFKVIDQEKMGPFFSELMQNADFNKAFTTFNHSNSASLSNNLDYMYIRNVTYEGKKYSGIGLFDWASYMGLK